MKGKGCLFYVGLIASCVMIVGVLFQGETSPWGISGLIVLLLVALISTQLNERKPDVRARRRKEQEVADAQWLEAKRQEEYNKRFEKKE